MVNDTVNNLIPGVPCSLCGEWVPYGQAHQCKGCWGGWHPPIKTVETCPYCGGIIEKLIDLNQEG